MSYRGESEKMRKEKVVGRSLPSSVQSIGGAAHLEFGLMYGMVDLLVGS